mmetsp:Transcript_45010/g.126808  ORF Transcript_45010/g.126808 Transcript_45010/m.126808 type:complete len:221 (+) Transcript_45010:987-1649(+)
MAGLLLQPLLVIRGARGEYSVLMRTSDVPLRRLRASTRVDPEVVRRALVLGLRRPVVVVPDGSTPRGPQRLGRAVPMRTRPGAGQVSKVVLPMLEAHNPARRWRRAERNGGAIDGRAVSVLNALLLQGCINHLLRLHQLLEYRILAVRLRVLCFEVLNRHAGHAKVRRVACVLRCRSRPLRGLLATVTHRAFGAVHESPAGAADHLQIEHALLVHELVRD